MGRTWGAEEGVRCGCVRRGVAGLYEDVGFRVRFIFEERIQSQAHSRSRLLFVEDCICLTVRKGGYRADGLLRIRQVSANARRLQSGVRSCPQADVIGLSYSMESEKQRCTARG